MASTNAPAGAENDKASKGESSGGRNLVLRAGSTASGAMPNSGKSIAESPPPTRRSASRESNQQMSPIANKLFSRNKRSKSRAFSVASFSICLVPPGAGRGAGQHSACRAPPLSRPLLLLLLSRAPAARGRWAPSASRRTPASPDVCDPSRRLQTRRGPRRRQPPRSPVRHLWPRLLLSAAGTALHRCERLTLGPPRSSRRPRAARASTKLSETNGPTCF
ncbi:uncharacterized protein LOC109527882 isoform X2 [Hippocampus comes]|uniref:uncharacterized protein LOC109527882 isoform X2 n=1 Tax=Hippocampus comes TaxID=109280 RepID=UPI00094EE426|nr:PREDICTED: uncharacterized protein LOC109527882 isoform X2 [Hippocampus comes]